MYIIPRYISAFVFISARNLVRFRVFVVGPARFDQNVFCNNCSKDS